MELRIFQLPVMPMIFLSFKLVNCSLKVLKIYKFPIVETF